MRFNLLLGVFFLVCSLNCFANERGNGGDPYEVRSLPYPDLEQLNTALMTMTEVTANDPTFSFISTILRDKPRKILFLKGDLIFVEGHDLQHATSSDGSVVAVTSFTYPYSGSNIYLTEKALKLSSFELSKLLVHEILHQELPKAFKRDELVVEELAVSIMERNYSAKIRDAYTKGIYLRRGTFSAVQFLEAFDLQHAHQTWWCDYLPDATSRDRELREQLYCKEVAKDSILTKLLSRQKSDNLWNASLADIYEYFATNIARDLKLEGYDEEVLRTQTLPSVLSKIILDQGLEAGPYTAQDICKQTMESGECLQFVGVGDLFL